MPIAKVMYRSTNGYSPIVDRRTAILESQPPDGGLYVPTFVPQFGLGEIRSLRGKSLPEVGYACMSKFLKGEMSDEYIAKMCEEALNFDMPVERLYDDTFLQKLGEGPTGAFKDTAARMLAREAQYYIAQGQNGESWLLVATSGDTGAAVAGAFHNVEGINVVVAYPRGGVTKTQAALMNTYGDNVIALECDGKFDDLQDMFMKAFQDNDLGKYKLWSANSIGIGMAQPQIIHAVYPLTKDEIAKSPSYPVFVVPSGNFGHGYAFLLAKKMGAYDEKLVIANNVNEVFCDFMEDGVYNVTDTIKTLSNAMDVNDPSNLRRVFDMFGGKLVKDKVFIDKNGKESKVCRIEKYPDLDAMKDSIWHSTVTDEEAKCAMEKAYKKAGVAVEPHGAVGLVAEDIYRRMNGYPGMQTVVMETAHPGKFPQVLEELGIPFETPQYMKDALGKKSYAVPFSNSFEDFKDFMLSGEAENVIRKQRSQ